MEASQAGNDPGGAEQINEGTNAIGYAGGADEESPLAQHAPAPTNIEADEEAARLKGQPIQTATASAPDPSTQSGVPLDEDKVAGVQAGVPAEPVAAPEVAATPGSPQYGS